MHITYDPEADALYIELRTQKHHDSVEVKDGVTIDLDAKGQIIGLEVLGMRDLVGCDPLDKVSLERLLPCPDEADREKLEFSRSGD
jgi:uncharacterized protein YuzE